MQAEDNELVILECEADGAKMPLPEFIVYQGLINGHILKSWNSTFPPHTAMYQRIRPIKELERIVEKDGKLYHYPVDN